MNFRKIKCKFILGLISAFICFSCQRNEVCNGIEKSNTLTIEILKAARQIVFNKLDVIILYNCPTSLYKESSYLLFYKKLDLYSIKCFASEWIESVKMIFIRAYVNEEKLSYCTNYQYNEGHNNYVIEYNDKRNLKGSRRIGNKLIQKMKFNEEDMSLTIDFIESKELYILIGETINSIDSSTLESFTKTNTLNIPLEDIVFHFTEQKIIYNHLEDGKWIRDNMFVNDVSNFTRMYLDIFEFTRAREIGAAF